MPTDPPTPLSESDLDYGPTLRGLREGLKVFDRYTLVRMLGRGGMGVVWLARDDKLDLDVALKFLPENLAHDEAALDDLRRETRRCMKLNHPHIVRVYDLVEGGAGDTAAIAMEYVEGKSLTGLRLEKPNRVFEVADIATWVRQVCGALEHAHTKGKMVHRDLKPANLMVDAGGGIRVMDFGIASSLGDSMSRQSKASQAHSGGGTLPYMSPQQLMGYPPSVSDDVYSLGATIYELLTGKPPFFRGELTRQIESITPPTITQRREGLQVEGATQVPAVWEQVIAACLEKDAEKRPKSMRTLLGELEPRRSSAAAPPPVSSSAPPDHPAGAPAAPESDPAPAIEHRYPSWVLPVCMAAIIGATGFNGWMRFKENRLEESRREAAARQRLAEEHKRPQDEPRKTATAQSLFASFQGTPTAAMISDLEYEPYLKAHAAELRDLRVAPVSSAGNQFERQAEGETFAAALSMPELKRIGFSSDLAAMAITKDMPNDFSFLCCEVRRDQLCLSLMEIGDGVFETLEAVSLRYNPNVKDDAPKQMRAFLEFLKQRQPSAKINHHAVVPARSEVESLLTSLSNVMPGERLLWNSSKPAAIAGAEIQSEVLRGTEQDILLLAVIPHAYSVQFPNDVQIEVLRPHTTIPKKARVSATWIPDPSHPQEVMLREMIGPAGTSVASTPVQSLPLPPMPGVTTGELVTVRATVDMDANSVIHFSLAAVDRSQFKSLDKAKPGDTRQIEVDEGVLLKLRYVQPRSSPTPGFWLAEEDCSWEQWRSVMNYSWYMPPSDDPKPVRSTMSPADLAEFVTRLNIRYTPPSGWEWKWPSNLQWEKARQMASEFPSLGFGTMATTPDQSKAGLRPILQLKAP